MTSNFETEIRSALSERANDVTSESVEHLQRSIRSPHRSTRVRAGLAGGSVAAAGLAAGLILAVVGPGATGAYAQWTSAPTTPTSGQVASAESQCLSSIGASSTAATGAFSTFISSAAVWNVDITDVRGPFTLVADSATDGTHTDQAACVVNDTTSTGAPTSSSNVPWVFVSNGDGMSVGGSSESGDPGQLHTSGSTSRSATALPDATTVSSPSITSSYDGASLAFGRAGSAVTGVVLALADGTSVVTSTSNGYYAAWWPSSSPVISATVTTAAGSTVVTFSEDANAPSENS